MQSHAIRTSLLAFLLLIGAGGLYVAFTASSTYTQLLSSERSTLARLDAMLAQVNELAVTQRGYFEPARGASSTSPQFQRVRQLTADLNAQVVALRGELDSPDAAEQMSKVEAALSQFATTDTRVRTNLANDTYFAAADLVFSASSTQLRSVTALLVGLKEQVGNQTALTLTELNTRRTAAVAVVGVSWALGLMAFALVRPATRVAALAPALQSTGTTAPQEPLAAPAHNPPDHVSEVALPAAVPGSVDLPGLATVCASIARASSATDLRDSLAAAASVLEASGLLVWLGAGEELFPALGHGYNPRMLARIGPLRRDAANATAAAWREGVMQVVPGEPQRPGAVVAPLIGAAGCIGVLAAEVGSGRETHGDVQAGTTLLAAQLSTVVAAWPEPSSTSGGSAEPPPEAIAASR